MDLTHKIQTYENMQDLKALISGLKIKLNGAVSKQNDKVLNVQLGSFYPLLREFLDEHKYSDEDIDTALDAFLVELTKLQVLDLELAFNPSSSFITKLVSWVNTNVTSNTILNISHNGRIIGGALITYKGKYGDFSSLRKLNEFFNKSQELAI